MSTIKLDLIHAFGSTSRQGYRGCLAVVEEDKNQAKIVFPIGKAMAKKSLDRQDMEFVCFHEATQKIESIVVLPTLAHVAVAYQPAQSATHLIRIYSLRAGQQPITIRVFGESQKKGTIEMMRFAPSEPKFMCALLGEPHHKLLFVDTFKNKALAESGFMLKDVDRLSICPSNSHLICVSGGSSVKLFRVEQYTFKPLEDIKKLPKGRRITTHTWYKRKQIIVATDRCQILIIEEGTLANVFQVKQEYHNVFNQPNGPGSMSVSAICTFTKGFILGSTTGKFCLWTRKEEGGGEGEQTLQISRKWGTTDERAAQVTNIEISAKEDIIAISLANNDIATLYISELIPQVSDLLREVNEKDIVFEYLYKGFHNAAITGMDICEQRPLIATCSQNDSTIRIWNYRSYGCKLLRMFYFKVKEEFDCDKPLLTLTFHPCGYYMAVGCVDKLRLFHVLNAELRPYREVGVRGAHIVKFSRGGHLMAACFPLREQTSMDQIKVFNALTLQEMVCLKDHTSSICSLQFKRYDEALLSISEEGMVTEWKVADWNRSKQITKKDMRYQCGIYCHSRNSIIAFGVSHGKRYIEEMMCEGSSVSQFETEWNVLSMTEIQLGRQRAVLLSLSNGSLIIFGGLQKPIVMDGKNCHLQGSTCVVKSPCGRYVMTAGADGVVLVFELLKGIEGGVLVREDATNSPVDDFLGDVVLINRSEITKLQEKQGEFSKVISQLNKKLKQLAEQGQKKHTKRMFEIQLQKNRVIEDCSFRIERLKSQIAQLQQKNASSLEVLDSSHKDKAEEMEAHFQEKIAFQMEKYFQLQQELIQMRLIHQRQMQDLKVQEEKEIAQLKGEFEGKFKESEMVYSKSKQEAEKAMSIFQQRLQQIEEEQEEEIRQLGMKKHKFKQQTANTLTELYQKQTKLQKQHAKLTEQKDEERAKNDMHLHDKRRVEKQVEEAKQKLKDMTEELSEKSEALRIKEQRISEFDKKVADLQKKKHILAYKGTEMKKAMEPKEVQMAKLKGDLVKLKKEFEASLQRKQKMALLMQRNEKERQNLEKLVKQERACTDAESEKIDQILGDVFHCLEVYRRSGDDKIFYKQFVKLFHRYIGGYKGDEGGQGKGIDELTRQVLHLQKSLYQITRSNNKTIVRRNQEINKRIKENTQLVTNLNDIKKINKQLIMKIKSKKDEIAQLKATKGKMVSQCQNTTSHAFKMLMQEEEEEQKTTQERVGQASIVRKSVTKIQPLSQKDQAAQARRSFQKMECQLMSELEFTNEKVFKLQFFIKEMKEKIRRHLMQTDCSPDAFVYKEEILQIKKE